MRLKRITPAIERTPEVAENTLLVAGAACCVHLVIVADGWSSGQYRGATAPLAWLGLLRIVLRDVLSEAQQALPNRTKQNSARYIGVA
jgi:hypothetical protein